MTDPADPADPGRDQPAQADPAALAADLREALRPLWRRFKAHRTLSMGKIGILSHLHQRGALAATDLAGLERISHQGVANAVRELEVLGLVIRRADPADRRRSLVTLTEDGHERLATERSAGQDWLTHAVREELTADEHNSLATAIPLLRRLDGPSDERRPQ